MEIVKVFRNKLRVQAEATRIGLEGSEMAGITKKADAGLQMHAWHQIAEVFFDLHMLCR